MGRLIPFMNEEYRPSIVPDINQEEPDHIYVVTRDDWEKDRTHVMGYARGDPAIIEAFYSDEKYNNVRVTEVDVRTITRTMLTKKQGQQARKALLLRELGQLEKELLEDEKWN